jgi:hypothetical protein
LAPHFQIPETHPKEPRYATPEEVAEWLQEVGVVIEGVGPNKRVAQDNNMLVQKTLFRFDQGDFK